jgi:1-deoxy-D-xylulose-5-phosphate synthase
MANILDKVNSPADLKTLPPEELAPLAEEIRALIIDTVSRTGGHLAANLGVVELTLALLRTFDPPGDKIVWDVSHQAYAYKILTGRKERFATLRQFGGISGFLNRAESPCDAFGAGHSGTAISAALGMAAARDRTGGREHVVAIVGDGALGCGISFEALNNVAGAAKRLIVILNDNEMSIAANVGSLARHLGKLLANPSYNQWKGKIEGLVARRITGRTAWLRRAYYRMEEALKSMVLRSVIFEEFGLRYVGPIDGHDITGLTNALSIAKDYDRPILLHVSTQKGRGYPFAEAHPDIWHGTSAFDVETGKPAVVADAPTYSQTFSLTLERLAARDERIVAITAAMRAGTGLSSFAERFPDRFFDVGISEEHAVVFAAGLAARGLLPVFAVYSTFLQRAVDGVIHDICLQNLPVILCLDRAGLVGDDGPTHHGVFDLALLRAIPNLVLMQPADGAELAHMLYSAVRWSRPVAIRYPRGAGPAVLAPEALEEIPLGKAQVLKDGWEIQIWALGDMLPLASQAADLLARRGLSVGIVNPRFVVPLDRDLLQAQAKFATAFVTIENHVVSGGFGSALDECLGELGFAGRTLRFGWPNQFIPQGACPLMMEKYGLTPAAIADAVMNAMRG